jgi:large-conductance mechanosensitive channel
MSSGRIARHRNYGELMARHEKEIRIKRIVRLFIYFLMIAFIVILFMIVRRVEKKASPGKKSETGMAYQNRTADQTAGPIRPF